ncbi:hypothetical protein BAnh1_11140 [Bartonella australis AUST/NH1]|uniref:Uncharacterized protein n=1 Tax=Bartonella australis (strain Aust/NH1) TaxID=1094489 RepID=M1P034_BARAA|nr:hypothetical protein [Bartonella australis]AGF74982.1 hypothetical protein BAnh1_11140 [Bartonella australis AUST/NH1]
MAKYYVILLCALIYNSAIVLPASSRAVVKEPEKTTVASTVFVSGSVSSEKGKSSLPKMGFCGSTGHIGRDVEIFVREGTSDWPKLLSNFWGVLVKIFTGGR